jgi:hypothetical protein
MSEKKTIDFWFLKIKKINSEIVIQSPNKGLGSARPKSQPALVAQHSTVGTISLAADRSL